LEICAKNPRLRKAVNYWQQAKRQTTQMKRPFNIFPSIAYRNSQLQIVSSVDNLKIDIYDQNKIIKSIEANSKNPVLLTSLGVTGKLIAKCNFNNIVFQQDLEIKEESAQMEECCS
jgi:hypothetical protein